MAAKINWHRYGTIITSLCHPMYNYDYTTGAVPANQPVSGGEATDRRKSFRRKMADCPS